MNYVPNKVLTLRAEISANWPEIMKRDADKMSNVILFEALSPRRTRIVSYGMGYKASKEYESLMKFFIAANKKLYGALKKAVEPS